MTQIVASGKQAVSAKQAAGDDSPQQYLTFSLGGEVVALGILHVNEIIEFGNVTEIPMMPAFIRGVINLRGAVVPVIDLSARFGGKASTISRRTCIVIVELESEDGKQDLGVIVDAVNEVLELPRTEIEPPHSLGAKIRDEFIKGMGKVEGRFVIILNIERVLSTEEIAMLARIGDDDGSTANAE